MWLVTLPTWWHTPFLRNVLLCAASLLATVTLLMLAPAAVTGIAPGSGFGPDSGADVANPRQGGPGQPRARSRAGWQPLARVDGEPARWAPCDPIPVTFDREDDATLLAVTSDVVADLATRTGLDLHLDPLADPGPDTITVAQYDDSEWRDRFGNEPAVAGRGGATLAGQWFQDGRVWLRDSALDGPTGQLTRVVLMHEMGHALGLDHVPNPSAIMNATGVTADTWSPGDLRGLAAVGRHPADAC